MDHVLRLLLGIPIFVLVLWLWALLFALCTTVVNGLALGLARLLRRVFGIRGQWDFGTAVARLGVEVGKVAATVCFWVAVLWYAFLYPTGAAVAEVSATLTAAAVLMIWMPSLFLLGLFADRLS